MKININNAILLLLKIEYQRSNPNESILFFDDWLKANGITYDHISKPVIRDPKTNKLKS